MTSISNCSGFCDQRYLCQGVVAILMDEFIASIHNILFLDARGLICIHIGPIDHTILSVVR